jgi:hypothetical protein
MKLFFVFLLLFQADARASSPPECMASRGGSWSSLELMPSMTRQHCPGFLELSEGLYLMRYQLTEGPIETGSKVNCHWSWVPDGGSHLAPFGEAPDTIVCSLSL